MITFTSFVIGALSALVLLFHAWICYRLWKRYKRKQRRKRIQTCADKHNFISLSVNGEVKLGSGNPIDLCTLQETSNSEAMLSQRIVPQIRISVSSSNIGEQEAEATSVMRSNLSAAPPPLLPPWMEKRLSFNMPRTPDSPSSPLSSSSTFKEPLLGANGRRTGSLFWGLITRRALTTPSSPVLLGLGTSAGCRHRSFNAIEGYRGYPVVNMFPFNIERDVDDREIDNRSILHYELGATFEKQGGAFSGDKNCFRGTLTFSLRYDFIHRVLMLHVIGCSDLPQAAVDTPPDPYVKMYLLPERRNHWKTKIIKRSSDPAFNEVFSFDVAYNELSDRMLQFIVYSLPKFDRFTRHDIVGNVIMRDLFERKSDLYHWTQHTMKIIGSQDKNDYGDLLLYLAYSSQLKKLYVTISKAYNLRPMDITGASDPYVRVEQIYQRKRVRMRRTSTKKANLNPVYHECLEFDLPECQIGETNFLIRVMDWDRIGSDDLLGCCILGKESPTKEGREQWERAVVVAAANASRRASSITSGSWLSKRDSTDACSCGGSSQLVVNEINDHAACNSQAKSAPAVCKAEPCNDATSGTPIQGRRTQFTRKHHGLGTILSTGKRGHSTPPPNMVLPQAVGQWHSILGDVPEGFRSIPKAKK